MDGNETIQREVCLGVIFDEVERTKTLVITTFVTCTLNVLFALFAFIANIAVITVILRKKKLRKSCHNIILGLLSLNDATVSVFIQPLFVIRKLLTLSNGIEKCGIYILWTTLGVFFGGCSLLTLVILSLERYASVFYVVQHRNWITNSRAAKAVLLSWLVPAFVSTSHFYSNSEIFYLSGAIGMVCNAFFCIFVYVSIFRFAKKLQPTDVRTGNRIQRNFKERQQLRETRISRNMAYIILAIFCCYIPEICSFLILYIQGPSSSLMHYLVFPWTDSIALFKSALDPVLFCWKSREIRGEINNLISAVRGVPVTGQDNCSSTRSDGPTTHHVMNFIHTKTLAQSVTEETDHHKQVTCLCHQKSHSVATVPTVVD